MTPVSQAKSQRASGTGSLTKRLSGRFSQEAFAAKEQELSFLQQRCVQFEVRFGFHQAHPPLHAFGPLGGTRRGVMRAGSMPLAYTYVLIPRLSHARVEGTPYQQALSVQTPL